MTGKQGTGKPVVICGDCGKVVIAIHAGCCGPGGGGGGGTCGGGGGGTGGGGSPVPVPTPYLVIPVGPGDTGTRPLPTAAALMNAAIAVTIVGGSSFTDYQFQISCQVANLGTVASPAAMIEFYTGAAIGIWNPAHDTLTPAQVQAAVQLVGRASVIVPPGGTATVSCSQNWVPGSAQNAEQGLLVQVSDLFTDPWTAPFDAVNDRHVARFDAIMDPVIF